MTLPQFLSRSNWSLAFCNAQLGGDGGSRGAEPSVELPDARRHCIRDYIHSAIWCTRISTRCATYDSVRRR